MKITGTQSTAVTTESFVLGIFCIAPCEKGNTRKKDKVITLSMERRSQKLCSGPAFTGFVLYCSSVGFDVTSIKHPWITWGSMLEFSILGTKFYSEKRTGRCSFILCIFSYCNWKENAVNKITKTYSLFLRCFVKAEADFFRALP